MDNKGKKKPTYTAASIKQEEGAEAHRKRVSRYMGASDILGIENQLFEIIDNSMDECVEYYTSDDINSIHYNPIIEITIRSDYSVVVQDWGRGIPCEAQPKTGIPAIYIVAEKDSAGGKGRDTEGYKTNTAGVHGAGMAVAKSCAEYFRFFVSSSSADGKYELEYIRGERNGELKRVGDLDVDENGNKISGTRIEYKYDDTLFTQTVNGRKVDQPIYKHMIVERLKYMLLGCEVYIKIRLNFMDEEPLILDPNTHTPEKFLGDTQLVKVKIDGSNTIQEHTSSLYLSLQRTRIEGIHKTIVNRLSMGEAPNNKATLDVVKDILDELLKRDKSLHEELQGSVVPFQLLKNRLSFLNILSLKDAEYSGQTKSVLKSTKFLPDFTLELSGQLRQSQDFIKLIYFPIKDLLLQEKRMEKERLKVQEKIKKERELSNDKRSIENTVSNLREDAFARAQRKENSRITIKSSPKPISESTLVYVEGQTGGGIFNDLNAEEERPIAIASLEGKLPNVISDKKLTEITIDNRIYCLDPGYKDIAILTDPDTDGRHIEMLLCYQIWKYARHYLEQGKVYLIPSAYSKVYVREPMILELYGQVKAYAVGVAYTFSAKEHQSLIKAGARLDKRYKGLADSGISPMESVKDRSTWIRIKPVIAEDIRLLEKVLEESSEFKATFMAEVFSSRQFFSKKIVNSKKEIELDSKELHKLLNRDMVSETPELMNYVNYVDQNTLKKYGVY